MSPDRFTEMLEAFTWTSDSFEHAEREEFRRMLASALRPAVDPFQPLREAVTRYDNAGFESMEDDLSRLFRVLYEARQAVSSPTFQGAGDWRFDVDEAPQYEVVWMAYAGNKGDLWVAKAKWSQFENSPAKPGWFNDEMGYRIEPYAWMPRQKKPVPPAPPQGKDGGAE